MEMVCPSQAPRLQALQKEICRLASRRYVGHGPLPFLDLLQPEIQNLCFQGCNIVITYLDKKPNKQTSIAATLKQLQNYKASRNV